MQISSRKTTTIFRNMVTLYIQQVSLSPPEAHSSSFVIQLEVLSRGGVVVCFETLVVNDWLRLACGFLVDQAFAAISGALTPHVVELLLRD